MRSRVGKDLLLRAALLRHDEAVSAWIRWEGEFGLDSADAASLVLLPQLYRNLMDRGVEPERLSRLKGIYRHQWTKSQRQLPALAEAFRVLHRASVPCVLMGGLALRTAYYPEPGLRPLADGDVWIPSGYLLSARKAFLELGWQPLWRSPLRRLKDRIRRRFFQTWVHPNEQKLHVHRHLVSRCPSEALDRTLVADATSLFLLDAPVQALSPSAMLLTLLSYDSTLPIATADAAWVLRLAGDHVDRSHLTELARRHHFLQAVQNNLRRMRAIVPVDILPK